MSLLAELAQQLRYAAEELERAEAKAGRKLNLALELEHVQEMARIIEEALAEDLAGAEIEPLPEGEVLH